MLAALIAIMVATIFAGNSRLDVLNERLITYLFIVTERDRYK